MRQARRSRGPGQKMMRTHAPQAQVSLALQWEETQVDPAAAGVASAEARLAQARAACALQKSRTRGSCSDRDRSILTSRLQ